MQSPRSDAAGAASRIGSLGDQGADTVLPDRGSKSTPVLVLRARLQWRLPGPALVALALALAASGRLWGVLLVPLAAPFIPALWIRLVVGEHTIRRYDWRAQWTTVSLDTVDAFRLRRVPWPALAWLRRGYRIGRFWSVPLTVRLQQGETVELQVRCIWWRGWRNLARFAALLPDVELDGRTRGRLGRYVGSVRAAAPVHA